MILSDASLRQLLASGKLSIDPLDDDQIQPASVDLRLSDHFLKVDENRLEAIRLDREVPYEELTQERIVIPRTPSSSPPPASASACPTT